MPLPMLTLTSLNHSAWSAGGRDVDLGVVDPDQKFAVMLGLTEQLGFFCRHLGYAVEQPGGERQGRGAAPGFGIAPVAAALADVVGVIRGEVFFVTEVDELVGDLVDQAVVVLIDGVGFDERVDRDDVDLMEPD